MSSAPARHASRSARSASWRRSSWPEHVGQRRQRLPWSAAQPRAAAVRLSGPLGLSEQAGQFDEGVWVLGRPAQDRLGLLQLTDLPEEAPEPSRRLGVATGGQPVKHLCRLIIKAEMHELAGNGEDDCIHVPLWRPTTQAQVSRGPASMAIRPAVPTPSAAGRR